MNKKLILALFAAFTFTSAAALQQNCATSACEFKNIKFELEEEDIEEAIEKYKKEFSKVLEKMNNFMKKAKPYCQSGNIPESNEDLVGMFTGFIDFYSNFDQLESFIQSFQNLVNNNPKNYKNLKERFEEAKPSLKKSIDGIKSELSNKSPSIDETTIDETNDKPTYYTNIENNLEQIKKTLDEMLKI